MTGRTMLENEHAKQGVYQPDSWEDVQAMFDEASALVVPTIQKLGDILSVDMNAEPDDRRKIIRHYAQLVALGALAEANVGFQSAPIQAALNDLKTRHGALLREYLFQHGVRDADVLAEKMAAQDKEVRS